MCLVIISFAHLYFLTCSTHRSFSFSFTVTLIRRRRRGGAAKSNNKSDKRKSCEEYIRTRCEIKTWQHTHSTHHQGGSRRQSTWTRESFGHYFYCIMQCAIEMAVHCSFGGSKKRRRRKSWRKSKSKRPTPRRANELVKFPQHPTTTKKKDIVGEEKFLAVLFPLTFLALLLRWRTPDGLLRFSYYCWRGIRGWHTIIHATTHTHADESRTQFRPDVK